MVLAAVIWGITLPALLDPALALNFGADFVHFYTIGTAALAGAGHVLYDPAALTALQSSLVPSLADRLYLPLYPPQTALVFAPFALLSYGAASALWALVSAGGYAIVVWFATRQIPHLASDRLLLAAAALTFPPFWYLVMFRQNSVVVLTVLFVGSQLLERKRPVLAGVVLGLLALKPQFGIPFAAFALYRRDAWLTAGALGSAVLQGVTAMAVLGSDVVVEYLRYLPNVMATANVVEPVLYKSLSVRTLSRLLPSTVGQVTWIVACVGLLIAMLRVCRECVPVRLSLSAVILTSILINPHAYVYDGIVLALPLLWIAEWRLSRSEGRVFLYQCLAFGGSTLAMMPVTLTLGAQAAIVTTACAIFALLIVFLTSVRAIDSQFSSPAPFLKHEHACAPV